MNARCTVLARAAGLRNTLVAAVEDYGQNARCLHLDDEVEDPNGGR